MRSKVTLVEKKQIKEDIIPDYWVYVFKDFSTDKILEFKETKMMRSAGEIIDVDDMFTLEYERYITQIIGNRIKYFLHGGNIIRKNMSDNSYYNCSKNIAVPAEKFLTGEQIKIEKEKKKSSGSRKLTREQKRENCLKRLEILRANRKITI